MIPLKSEKDLQGLRVSGKILARIMQRLREAVKEGVTTAALDQLAGELMEKERVISAFKGYKGYPANICTSINEEIVHGIPTGRKIMQGDIVSLDAGINYQGYFSDTAITVPVGRVDGRSKKLIEVTREALSEGIKRARAENCLSDISYAIQNYVERNGFSVVREYVGHGIGSQLHEDPEIPNFGLPHRGPILKIGMVLAIEPMVNAGTWRSALLDNQWTAVTADNMPSAHFEHTIAITERGPEILTR